MENRIEIDRQFLKGSISLLLLNLLSRGEMYGYEILQEASRRSANAFAFKEGTLYPALHQLEKKGQIKSEWRTAGNGRERKYYSLTPKGRKAAADYERQWQHLTGAMAAILESK
ncbi:MAG TPA: PadR family transcriptional regulator [Bryobacteraceae bacterium]|nr:PadR family transcriptional regulator [Bryobacteraceae bacterium]